jgi:hypothetical protein
MGTGCIRLAVCVLCLAFVGAAGPRLVAAEEKAAGETIKAGDKVVVKAGPAPVMDGAKKVTEVETGTELTAQKVRGKWVQVKVVVDKAPYLGWIDALKHLSRPIDSEPHVAAKGDAVVPKELRWAVLLARSGLVSPEGENLTMATAEFYKKMHGADDTQPVAIRLRILQPKGRAATLDTKGLLELVGAPDQVRDGVPAQGVKDNFVAMSGVSERLTPEEGRTFRALMYGQIRLLADPANGQIQAVEAPLGWWIEGIKRKASTALAKP